MSRDIPTYAPEAAKTAATSLETMQAYSEAIANRVALRHSDLLFAIPVHAPRLAAAVNPEHAECEREGFTWNSQARLFDDSENFVCSKCGTRRPW